MGCGKTKEFDGGIDEETSSSPNRRAAVASVAWKRRAVALLSQGDSIGMVMAELGRSRRSVEKVRQGNARSIHGG